MKLQGDNPTSTKEMSKVFFPVLRRSRVAPEQNGEIVTGRHLECEEGSCDKGIIARILKKVGALGQGDSSFFRTRTYSPLKRSKSQERISTSLPITPFSSINVQPVLKTYKNVSRTQNLKTDNTRDTRRFSHSDVLSDKTLQLSKQSSKEDFSKTKFHQVDTKLTIPNIECAFKESKNSSETSKSKTETAKMPTKNSHIEVEKIKPKAISHQQINEIKETVLSSDAKNNLKDDSKTQIPSSEVVGIPGNVDGTKIVEIDGVTRIQIKYSAPVVKDELNIESDISKKNDTPATNSDFKLLQHEVESSKDNVSDSKAIVFESQFSNEVKKPIITAPKPTISSSSSSSAAASVSSPLISSSSSSSFSNTSYPSSLWSLRASTSSAKSKSNPGKMTIRPASNLNASKLKSEFLKLTEFNDIKIGEFSAPTKKQKKVEIESIFSVEAENDDNDYESFEFIGAGIIQGKSILAKAKSNKRRSVNFNEAPVVHLISSACGDDNGGDGGSDDDDCDQFSSRYSDGSTSKIFSSPSSTISKGSLSSYKSKSLADFEFDFDDPPMLSKPNPGASTCREQASDMAFHSDEKAHWSSNNNIDLLF